MLFINVTGLLMTRNIVRVQHKAAEFSCENQAGTAQGTAKIQIYSTLQQLHLTVSSKLANSKKDPIKN